MFRLRLSKAVVAWIISWLICLSGILAGPASAEDSEVRLGRKEHQKLLETTHFYQDPILNNYVNSVGQKLAANSDWPEIEYHFFIVDSPDINAFALPGGYIYINRGLLAHLTSEAQLAAVLAHEIAHVTRHHAVRRRSKQRLGNAAAIVASIATLNSHVGEAINLENAARISGYGREMELEADEYGASYLYNTGYDPLAMIEVLGVLKDHERFSKLQKRKAGKAPQTYHGVFASHPKNDQRLKQSISQAGQLPPGEDFRGRDIYRKMLANMVFGDNDTSLTLPKYQRYASEPLGVTFVYPDSWIRSIEGAKIVLRSSDDIQLEIRVEKAKSIDPLAAETLLKEAYQVDKLHRVKPVYDNSQADQAAYAQIERNTGMQRVAVIKLGSYQYYFAITQPIPLSEQQDQLVLDILRSFRVAQERDFPPENIQRIYFHRLEPGQTFADLAVGNVLGSETEAQLRLINGYYPKGEAEPGSWIKMVR